MEGRIIGLDYGSRTVGVALSDPLRMTAQAMETIHRKDENKLRQTLARIENYYQRTGCQSDCSWLSEEYE